MTMWLLGVWRILKWVFAAGVVVFGGAALTAYLIANRSAPDYSASYDVAGPRAEIEIVRDARAVPHIFAKTEYDGFFGLGFAHAQDRLWQMMLRRALVQGRVSELAGRFAAMTGRDDFLLQVDVTMRALDLHGHATRALQHQRPETLRALEAYAAGVNAWLEIVEDDGLGAGAPELRLLGADLAPWRPEDSIAAFKMLAATLMGSPFFEIRRSRYLLAQGPERLTDLFPAAPGAPVMALPPYASLFGAGTEFASAEDPRAALMGRAGLGADWPHGLDAGDYRGASNAWAVSGARSATRAPLLASDPHLPLSAPSVWYLARIGFPDGGVIGGTIPGIPSVLAGRNEHLAWGPTTLYSDTADLFMEEIDPDDPSRYRTAAGWDQFETRQETITRGDGGFLDVTLRRSRHGPILPLDWPALAEITPLGAAPALSWTLLTDIDRSLAASMDLMRARSVDKALSLAADVVAPPQLITLADQDKIAMIAVGHAPERRAESLGQGRVAAAGWRLENDWVGLLPLEDLPKVVDPPSGAVANANNRVEDAEFPKNLGFEWPAPYRINRLSDLVTKRQFHTMAGFRTIQNDTVSEMARGVLPLIAGPLWRIRDTETGQRRAALDLLARWNGEMGALLPEPLIFTAWMRALTSRLTADELGALASEYAGLRPLFIERVFRDIDGAGGRWCDDRETDVLETCAEIASLALDDALAELSASYGSEVSRWRWGKAHMALHRHQPFGGTGLGFLFNIEHETGGGDHTLLRGQTPGRGDAPYRNVHAGGFRAIYDFADLDRSIAALSTGQSGHFLSRHYDDLAEIWRTNEYFPLSLDRRDADAGAVGVTVLTPTDG